MLKNIHKVQNTFSMLALASKNRNQEKLTNKKKKKKKRKFNYPYRIPVRYGVLIEYLASCVPHHNSASQTLETARWPLYTHHSHSTPHFPPYTRHTTTHTHNAEVKKK